MKNSIQLFICKTNAYNNFELESLSKFDECMRVNNLKYTLTIGSILETIH